MDEISASTNVWQEKSRWIQYEENLQEGSRRWGPPHVPLFSFHSFLQLRSLIETGKETGKWKLVRKQENGNW